MTTSESAIDGTRQTPEQPGKPQAQPPWHARDVAHALEAFGTRERGLDHDEARRRLDEHGLNRLPQGKRASALMRLLRQFHNLLIYILIAAAIVTLALGHPLDSAVIVAVVIVNAVVGYVQEGRAEEALEAIRGMINPRASIMRGGNRMTVAAEEIAPGDIVIVEAGDRVPADLRLLRARSLKIDEAILTGESVAVDKHIAPVDEDAPLGDRASMAFSGSFIAAGQGAGVAVATGERTELGRISQLIGGVEGLETPLVRQMDEFARRMTFIILILAAGAFAFAVFVRAYELEYAFMTGVSLAVATIPAGLPAVMTITLAIGVRRMAARHAIVRRLPAVETLGSVSVICSDKTGTLTRNEMTARSLHTLSGSWDAQGEGYEPTGAVHRVEGTGEGPADVRQDALACELMRAALLCNDASIRQGPKGWTSDGDPMEGALVALAMKAGLDPQAERARLRRLDEIPFDSQHRFMATLHAGESDGERIVFVKGAPERIIDMCARQRTPEGETEIDAAAWHVAADAMAAQGQRVLAFAMRVAPDGHSLSFEEVEQGVALIGLVGFIDPPREEARTAVAECCKAGIRVMMITGDHAVTAREIGRQLGLAPDPVVMEGRRLDALDDDALRAAARDTHVFARTTPEHKLRLVKALQAGGQVVAMTGDGVNDAPALKRADVGVAMGQKGTEAAKEASEVVLADDNFASIAAAVREGRTVYDNIMKVIGWTLPTNGGEALTIIAALAFGLALPVTPVQILWINMVTAVTLGLTLAFEPTEPGTMRRPPRRPDQPILSGELLWRVLFVSVLVVCGGFSVFYLAEARGQSVEAARTHVVNAIVAMEIFYLFNVRFAHGQSLTLRGAIGTPAVLAGVGIVVLAQLAITYAPFMNLVFGTQPASLVDMLIVVGVGLALFVLVEIEKAIRLHVRDRSAPRAA